MSTSVSGATPPTMNTSLPGTVWRWMATMVGWVPPGPGCACVVVVVVSPSVDPGPGSSPQLTVTVSSGCQPEESCAVHLLGEG